MFTTEIRILMKYDKKAAKLQMGETKLWTIFELDICGV